MRFQDSYDPDDAHLFVRIVEEATDVLWALTSYDLYRLLVVERSWTPGRYETWLAQLLVEHLLQPTDRCA